MKTDGIEPPPTDQELDRLRVRADRARNALRVKTSETAEALDAVAAYEVGLVRSEYNALASRNYILLQHLGRSTKRLLAGLAVMLLLLGLYGLKISHDVGTTNAARIHEVQNSRRDATERSCQEANARHDLAKHGLETLALHTAPRTHTPIAKLRQRQVIDAFVNALVPQYDCKKRTRELTGPAR